MSFRISIDPGIEGTGIALWDERTWHLCVQPQACFNIMPDRTCESWQGRAESVLERMETYLQPVMITHAYCEFPQVWQGTARGNAAARGLPKLLVFTGLVYAGMRNKGAEVTFYEPETWKGQLSKEIVERRIKARIPSVELLKPTTHCWDAIGIGLHAKGFLNVGKQTRQD